MEIYMKKALRYFSTFELVLWLSSLAMILLSFLLFDRANYTALAASLVGTTALIFCAKGNPLGQLLMLVFSLIYAAISFTFAYYGEVITYLGMTLPMATIGLVSWLKNPYGGNRAEVKVSRVGKKEALLVFLASIIITVAFYYILKYFGTANLLPSTLSVSTSFFAAYLSFRRSPYFAAAYALNDVVLIVLWVIASIHNAHYISVVVCFFAFLLNDIYGFINWRRMEKRQVK